MWIGSPKTRLDCDQLLLFIIVFLPHIPVVCPPLRLSNGVRIYSHAQTGRRNLFFLNSFLLGFTRRFERLPFEHYPSLSFVQVLRLGLKPFSDRFILVFHYFSLFFTIFYCFSLFFLFFSLSLYFGDFHVYSAVFFQAYYFFFGEFGVYVYLFFVYLKK